MLFLLRRVSGVVLAKRAMHWTGLSAWSMADQAIFAISNFTVSIMLARWLTPIEYGTFSIAYTLLTLAWTPYKGFLVDPMMVFTSDRFRDQIGAYHSCLLVGYAVFSSAITAVFLLTGAISHRYELNTAQVPWSILAVAAPMILLSWMLREFCHARLEPWLATKAAVLYMLFLLVGMVIHYNISTLSIMAVFMTMAGTSIVATVWLIDQLELPVPVMAFRRSDMVWQVMTEHWQYGRWSVLAGLLSWIPLNIWYTALPVLSDLKQAAAFRALFNFALPAVQCYAALSSVLIPMFVLAKQHGRLGSAVGIILAVVTASASVFVVTVDLFQDVLFDWLYHGQYKDHASLVWPAVLVSIPIAANVVFSAALQALRQPNRLVLGFGVGAITTVLVGLPATAAWGLSGAVAGQLCTLTTISLALGWLLRQAAMPPGGAAPAPTAARGG
jgi:O-antigen/teichoic acid export membrane protein